MTAKHLAMLDGTWCGEPYDETTCAIDPSHVTCATCLSAAADFGERARQQIRRMAASSIEPGMVVEWDARGGPRRAAVHRIDAGRIFIRWPRRPTKRHPEPYTESWFDAHEGHLLRVVQR